MTCLTNGDDFAVIVAAREKYVKMQHRLAVLRFRMAAFCQLHVFPTNACTIRASLVHAVLDGRRHCTTTRALLVGYSLPTRLRILRNTCSCLMCPIIAPSDTFRPPSRPTFCPAMCEHLASEVQRSKVRRSLPDFLTSTTLNKQDTFAFSTIDLTRWSTSPLLLLNIFRSYLFTISVLVPLIGLTFVLPFLFLAILIKVFCSDESQHLSLGCFIRHCDRSSHQGACYVL
jgi:hypothetical protein